MYKLGFLGNVLETVVLLSYAEPSKQFSLTDANYSEDGPMSVKIY